MFNCYPNASIDDTFTTNCDFTFSYLRDVSRVNLQRIARSNSRICFYNHLATRLVYILYISLF